MFAAFAASPGSLGVAVGNVQRPATVSFGLRASPQLTALFTSAAIRFSSAAVNSVSAQAVGHMVPSSRLAASWTPNVEYLKWYFCPLWKKQTTLPSLLAYAGIPYQVFGDRSGALLHRGPFFGREPLILLAGHGGALGGPPRALGGSLALSHNEHLLRTAQRCFWIMVVVICTP
jgi:hypothetical protein